MATPYLSQHAMASSSLTLPPGCAMHVTPALHAFSTASPHAEQDTQHQRSRTLSAREMRQSAVQPHR